MGSVCCKRAKYAKLEEGNQMKRTAFNKKVTTVILRRISTRDQLAQVLKVENAPYGLITVLNPPYSNFDLITSGVFITAAGGMVKENIVGQRITCIINTTFEAPNYKIEGIECIRVPVDDNPDEDLLPYFNDVSDKINEVREKNGRTLVHCVAGVSRSVTFVLAYLIKYKKMSLKEAFLFVRQKRPIMKPKCPFIEQLIEYEKTISGKTSVKMIEIKRRRIKIYIPDFYVNECSDLLQKELDEMKGGLEKEKIMEQLSERSAL